jgi:hypothetical protein
MILEGSNMDFFQNKLASNPLSPLSFPLPISLLPSFVLVQTCLLDEKPFPYFSLLILSSPGWDCSIVATPLLPSK